MKSFLGRNAVSITLKLMMYSRILSLGNFEWERPRKDSFRSLSEGDDCSLLSPNSKLSATLLLCFFQLPVVWYALFWEGGGYQSSLVFQSTQDKLLRYSTETDSKKWICSMDVMSFTLSSETFKFQSPCLWLSSLYMMIATDPASSLSSSQN